MPTKEKVIQKHMFPKQGSGAWEMQVHCNGMLYDAGVGYDIQQVAVAAGDKAVAQYSYIADEGSDFAGEDGPTAEVIIRCEDGPNGYVIVDYRILGPFLINVMRDPSVEQVGLMKIHHRKAAVS